MRVMRRERWREGGILEPMSKDREGSEQGHSIDRNYPPNWEMQTEPGGVFACAVEGGDCCCQGEVRLGKENPDGVSHWTPWQPVSHWVSCHTS